MATISFFIDTGIGIQNLAGSGLGFYGAAGFGASVLVGDYQDTTFVTNGAGSTQGPQADNVKYVHPNSGSVNGTTYNLLAVPNKDATLRINFSHTSSVQVQNAIARIYDRVSTSNGASGVTTKLAEIIHPDPTATQNGSGDATWYTINAGVASSIPLANSPGASGYYAGNGSNSVRPDTSHDFFLAISSSPDSIGSKSQFGLFVSLEYL